MEINETFFQLALKKVHEELSEKEEVQFSEFLKRSQSNKEVYNNLIELNAKAKNYKYHSSLNIDHEWMQLLSKAATDKPNPGIIRYLSRSLFDRVAVILLIVASVGLLYHFIQRGQPNVAMGQPGQSIAFLTIDGEEKMVNSENSKTTNYHYDSEKSIRYDASTEQNVTINNHLLRVPRGGEYQLILSDGTHVWLNSETVIQYPQVFTGDEREVTLIEGEGFFEVAKDIEKPFVVNTNKMSIKVLGTIFNVSAYKTSNDVSATLVEGSIEVSDQTGRNTIIEPGWQYKLTENSSDHQLYKVNVEAITSWKNGQFRYDNMPLEIILESISRWYDIDYEFLDKKSGLLKFTGRIDRNKPVAFWLELLSRSYPIKWEFRDQTLYLWSQ